MIINMIEFKKQLGIYETMVSNNIIDELDIDFALM
jgi:hypothetical protein